jgi:hypothetical protein
LHVQTSVWQSSSGIALEPKRPFHGAEGFDPEATFRFEAMNGWNRDPRLPGQEERLPSGRVR